MSVLLSMRSLTSVLVCAGFLLIAPETAQADCDRAPPASFDVREDPFNLSADERDAIIDVVHAFALTWDLRDGVNLPLLFIESRPDGGFLFSVCNSVSSGTNTGHQIEASKTRLEISQYFETGPFAYVMDNETMSQARHFISNIVVKSHQFGDVKVVADLLVTLQSIGSETQDPPPPPVVDYTGMIEAVLTKEWGGVWKFRELFIFMDVPGTSDKFRGR